VETWKHSHSHEKVGKIYMNPRALLITLLVIIGQMAALGGVVLSPRTSDALSSSASQVSPQPEFVGKSFLVAHLEEDDRDDDWQGGGGHRRHKKCHRRNHYHFCGSKSLMIKTIQELKFGRVVGDSRHGGDVVIHADTGSKTVNRLYDAGGFHSRAEFEIMGKPEKKFVVTLPSKIELPNITTTKPRVESFTVFPSSTGTFGPDGKARLFIGATLKVGPTQQGGEGSGPVPIYVDYVR
jgi:uncharacterized protein DUF4402